MKVILDTNVVISAVYFGGAPLKILRAWRDGHDGHQGIEILAPRQFAEKYL